MDWLWMALAALVVGISKTSVGGLGAIAVAIFALVMPAKESTAPVLLLLIVGDVVAVLRYRRHADWKLLLSLLPWVLPGLALGAWFLGRVDDQVLRKSIGAILGVMVVIQLVQRWRGRHTRHEPAEKMHWMLAGTAGMAAGFTTMTANAAGPVMTLYLLAAKVDKLKFIGTGAWYFLIVNLSKVPFSAGLGLFPASTLKLDLLLAPVVLLGTWIGIRLVRHISQQVFEQLALAASVLAAISLIVR